MSNSIKKSENVTLVCMSAEFDSGLMIREGRKIADETNTKLYVVNVQKKCEWGKKFSKELEQMLAISKKLDAEMLIFFSDDSVGIINDCIVRRNVKHLVFANSDKKLNYFKEQLYVESGGIEIHICKYK